MENNEFTGNEVELIRKIVSTLIAMLEKDMQQNPEVFKKFMEILKSMHNAPQVILTQGHKEIKWVKENIFEPHVVEDKDKPVMEKILLRMDLALREKE